MLEEPSNNSEKLPRGVGLLGGGIVGSGWAAKYILHGVNVRLYDPDRGAANRVQKTLAAARRAYRGLTFSPLPREGSLTLVASLVEAVRDVELVQESAPERSDLKLQLIAETSRAAAPETLIASSSSSVPPSLIQEMARYPERVLVGHPYNPVYLLPLVEVCGGKLTDPGAVNRTAEIYRSVCMRPLIRKESDGFIAKRLHEAVLREALWMVHDGVATAQEIDDSVRLSFGLRNPIFGPIQDYRITGAEQDARKAMQDLCRSIELRSSKLSDGPELTDEFLNKLAMQSDEQMAAMGGTDIEQARDDCIVRILRGLRRGNQGAGEVIARLEDQIVQRAPLVANSSCPFRMPSMEIPTSWMDFDGHITERRFLQLCGSANEYLHRHLGIDQEYRVTHGDFYTLETHLSHLTELHAGNFVDVCTQVLGVDEKRLHVFHVIKRRGIDKPVATVEQMLIHVSAETGRSAPMQSKVHERLRDMLKLHSVLPRPTHVFARVLSG
ncbi:3-hydroxyacyl-CoA dehydrogenase NAD-binding domain-containing protein [Mesorhizobium sp. M0027]|uniref:3-hydroxyacyl-CoA dehydrogenase NAD-binding domain-containing protein n=1 Tax=Mesorhizobium sp. M0027 TaxID=2956848 RepID=UPI00333A1534